MITRITSPYFDKYQLRPYNPAELFQKFGGYKVYHEMREDDQISALLRLVKHIIIQGGWDIECEDEDTKEFLEWNIKKVFIEQILYEILSAKDYGFSVSEPVFGREETQWGEKITLQRVATRPPDSWRIYQDDFGTITEFRQLNGDQELPIPPKKLIHYVNKPEFDNPYGTSDLNRGVYVAWWTKRAINKFWAMWLERHGMPTRVAKTQQGTSDEDKEDIRAVIRDMQSDTGVVIPDTIDLSFLQATDASGAFKEAVDHHNTAISRALLVPDLLGMSGGETDGGSYSLGAEQVQIFYQLICAERASLERLVDTEILARLIEFNTDEDIEACFKFRALRESERIERLKIVIDAVQKGVVTKDLAVENAVRQIAGLEELEELPEAPQGQTPPGEEPPAQGETDPEEEAPPAEEDPEEEPEAETMTKRYGLNKYDKKVNYAKIVDTLDSAEKDLKVVLGKIVTDSVNQLMGEVRKKNLLDPKKLYRIGELDLKRWGEFKAALKRGMRLQVREGTADAATETGEKKYAVDAWESPDTEEWLNLTTTTVARATKEKILSKIQQTLVSGVRAGEGIATITRRINDGMAEWDPSFVSDGKSASQLETLVRTNLSTAYNEGRGNYFEKAGDLIIGYMFSAVMDERTTDRCAQLNGEIFPAGELHSFNPPMHYNCRSILVPVTKFEDPPEFSDTAELKQFDEGKYFK